MYDAVRGVTEETPLCSLIIAALLVAGPAWAGLPVAYDADYQTLKKNVFIGDPLGFDLYETADCTGTPVSSEILGAGTPQVSVEEITPVPAKQQKPKPPTIAPMCPRAAGVSEAGCRRGLCREPPSQCEGREAGGK